MKEKRMSFFFFFFENVVYSFRKCYSFDFRGICIFLRKEIVILMKITNSRNKPLLNKVITFLWNSYSISGVYSENQTRP
jgi:hypothetical protein